MLASAQPLRLVLDTNVVVAGLLWNGPPRRLLRAAIDGEVDLSVKWLDARVWHGRRGKLQGKRIMPATVDLLDCSQEPSDEQLQELITKISPRKPTPS